MHVVGECQTDGTIRIEGTVQGTVRAGKAVVVGKDGVIDGDVFTQDAVISGRVNGTLVAESRLELQATCTIEGEVCARRMQLEEGAILNGTLRMGETFLDASASTDPAVAEPAALPMSEIRETFG
jgi:cytoskeletal protein CcmA (bactofilin family)